MQIVDKVEDIYLLVDKEETIGSVACYGNEIDDLIVSQEFQRQGYGKQLLLWAIWHIRERSNEPITLHVAAWNQGAIMLYEKCGFERSHVLKDFFTDHYDHPIYECGVLLQDMVYLRYPLL